jgi:hypothetical protein
VASRDRLRPGRWHANVISKSKSPSKSESKHHAFSISMAISISFRSQYYKCDCPAGRPWRSLGALAQAMLMPGTCTCLLNIEYRWLRKNSDFYHRKVGSFYIQSPWAAPLGLPDAVVGCAHGCVPIHKRQPPPDFGVDRDSNKPKY